MRTPGTGPATRPLIEAQSERILSEQEWGAIETALRLSEREAEIVRGIIADQSGVPGLQWPGPGRSTGIEGGRLARKGNGPTDAQGIRPLCISPIVYQPNCVSAHC
jgi:hypothetical protein